MASMSRTEENIAKVYQILCENGRPTVRSIADQETSTEKTVRKILTEDGRCVQKWSQRTCSQGTVCEGVFN
jgi:predicted transcriptional regulator